VLSAQAGEVPFAPFIVGETVNNLLQDVLAGGRSAQSTDDWDRTRTR
jgi:hypothetical protein